MITTAALRAVRENYKRGPVSRDRALEALNALAAATAIIILGTDGDNEAKEFFLKALEQNIEVNKGYADDIK